MSHAEPKKHCRFCYSPMPVAANKCVACQEQQDWRRYLGFSSTILSLLVALISVVTFAIPIWKASFYSPSPKPNVAVSEIDRATGRVFYTLFNGGDAPMIAGQASIIIRSDTKMNRYVIDPDSGDDVITSNSIQKQSGDTFLVV